MSADEEVVRLRVPPLCAQGCLDFGEMASRVVWVGVDLNQRDVMKM